MKLNSLNKYDVKKGMGNINKVKSIGNPNKTDLPYISGNQTSIASRKRRVKKFLGNDGGKKEIPTNLSAVIPNLI